MLDAKTTPLLQFGVIADVQYADNDDKPAWYNPSKTRYYRNSLNQLEQAFNYWDKQKNVRFVLQLGDIIDALSKSICSHSAIHRTIRYFLNNPHMPAFHTVGNHELYNFSRAELSSLFDQFLFKKENHASFHIDTPISASSPTLYYKFSPIKGMKFISLDTYDISVLGYDETHFKYKLAANVLKAYHGTDDVEVWDTDQKLFGEEKRFQASNGAISKEQLKWLDEELASSDLNNELVIVFGHVGLHPNSCGWDSILWNYDEVIDCFNRHSCVFAYFNGHAHNSGYAFENGVHYIVLHGIIETSPDTEAFITVRIFENNMVIDGRGVENKLILNYHKKYSFEQSNSNELIDSFVCDYHCNAIKINV